MADEHEHRFIDDGGTSCVCGRSVWQELQAERERAEALTALLASNRRIQHLQQFPHIKPDSLWETNVLAVLNPDAKTGE